MSNFRLENRNFSKILPEKVEMFCEIAWKKLFLGNLPRKIEIC